MNLKQYYKATYPSDNLGNEIRSKATFDGLLESINEPYHYIGVHDSIVRERLFEKLAKIKGVEYNDIYNLWIAN